jgi:hypothetical protein
MSVNDKIWLTARTRIQSEARLLRFERLSHVVLSYYSALMIAYSVLSIDSNDINKQYIQIIMSIAVFSASLISYGFKFGEQAREFRECYLSLNELYGNAITDQKKSERYADILSRYPNHVDHDFYTMIKKSRALGRVLKDSGGNDITIGGLESFKHGTKNVLFVVGIIGLFVFPAWALFSIFWPVAK